MSDHESRSVRLARLARWTSISLCLGLVMFSSGATIADATNAPDNIVPTATAPAGCSRGGALESNRSVVCQTDNASVSWWLEQSIEGPHPTTSPNDTRAETEINRVMNGSFQNTILHTFYDSSPVFSGPGETDVVYRSNPRDFNDPNRNWIGYTWCDDVATGGNAYDCDQQYINLLNVNTTSTALACHETGHSVGLTHGQDAAPVTPNDANVMYCMENPIDDNRNILGPNNVGNINIVYD